MLNGLVRELALSFFFILLSTYCEPIKLNTMMPFIGKLIWVGIVLVLVYIQVQQEEA
jgi:hypothetical protein